MSLVSIVIDKTRIRNNDVPQLKIVRVIIAFQDSLTNEVTIDSKYVYYPLEEYVYDDFCFKYNGINGHTISTRGEKYVSVIDWARAASRGKQVIVCSKTDIAELLGETPCHVIDLHDFFFTKTENKIEPVSLGRLTSRMFGDQSWSNGKRDAFTDCKSRLAMYHVMVACKVLNKNPPFDEIFFPKIKKTVGSHESSAPENLAALENWDLGSTLQPISRQVTQSNLSNIDRLSSELCYVNVAGPPGLHGQPPRSGRSPINDAEPTPDECGTDIISRGGRLQCKRSYKRLITRSDDRLSHVYSLIEEESDNGRSMDSDRRSLKHYFKSATKFVGRKCQAMVTFHIKSSQVRKKIKTRSHSC